MFRSGVSRRSPILVGQSQTTAFNRYVAKLIDITLVFAIYFIGRTLWAPLGPVLGALLAGVQDAFGEGQSVGKKIIGLRVVDDNSGLPCSVTNSFMRNLPLVLVILLSWIPVFWAFISFAAALFFGLESYLVHSLETGVRVGDVMANTQVVECLDKQLAASDSEDPFA